MQQRGYHVLPYHLLIKWPDDRLMKQHADAPRPVTHPSDVTAAICRPERLGVLAGRLARTLGLARALAQNGRTLDLSGIDDGIGMLCAQTLDLDQPEARQMLPLLHEVLGQVNALDATLRGGAEPSAAPTVSSARACKAYRQ
jgi:hypothetical protein